MTVDAVVNLFIQHAKNTENTLTTSQNEPDSQRQDHSSPVPNPLPLGPPPNITTSIHEEVAEPDYFENTHSSAQVARPAEERCVDLDVLSPPPLPSATLSEHGDCAFCGTIGTPRTCGILVGVRLGERDAAVHHACALWAPQIYQPQASKLFACCFKVFLFQIQQRLCYLNS